MQSSSYVFLAACLAASAQLGLGLKCYHCSSDANEACGDPFKTDPKDRAHNVDLVDCTPDLAERAIGNAVKIGNSITQALDSIGINLRREFRAPDIKMACIKAEIKTKEKEYITRSCGVEPKGELDGCKTIKQMASKSDGASVPFCDYCTVDGCNGAASTSASIGILAAALVVMLGYAH